MKCSICGYNARTIGAMGKHYRKAHPKRMKARKSKAKRTGKDWADRLTPAKRKRLSAFLEELLE